MSVYYVTKKYLVQTHPRISTASEMGEYILRNKGMELESDF